nr:hypothetical protein CFP56_57925 [Quercus suber]
MRHNKLRFQSLVRNITCEVPNKVVTKIDFGDSESADACDSHGVDVQISDLTSPTFSADIDQSKSDFFSGDLFR